eukprot:GHRR01021069.1.p1 GENE.GHRR01021069.1~~GHRR01021069.1.p1  ORF type:complete len:109 (+),score=29.18 GHRR01021069.1:347-673(+)
MLKLTATSAVGAACSAKRVCSYAASGLQVDVNVLSACQQIIAPAAVTAGRVGTSALHANTALQVGGKAGAAGVSLFCSLHDGTLAGTTIALATRSTAPAKPCCPQKII